MTTIAAFALIIYFHTGYAGGATTAYFETMGACETARVEIISRFPSNTFREIIAVCVPTGG